MLRYKIDKTAFDKLPKDVQAEYKADGDNYILDIDGNEVAGEALRARDNMKAERDEAKKAAEDAAAKLTAETTRADKAEKSAKEANEKIGKEIHELDGKYKEQITTLTSERDAALAKFDDATKDGHKKSVVDKIANEISTSPGLVGRLLADRITVEIVDGKPIERVLDKDGKPSAQSIADLRKEFVDNPELKPVIKASNASGGGAPNRSTGGGAPATTPNTDQNADVSKMSTPDLRARIEAKRAAATQQ